MKQNLPHSLPIANASVVSSNNVWYVTRGSAEMGSTPPDPGSPIKS